MFDTHMDWRSYLMPVMATLLLHALVIALIGGGWEPRPDPRPVVDRVKIVQAKLVTLKKEQPIVKPKPVVKPKPKPQSKPKPEVKKPQPVEKPEEKKPTAEELEQQRQQELAQQQEQQRLAAEQALTDLVADEDAELQADEDAVLVAQYTAMISQQMHQKWKLPPSARRNMVAQVSIRMLPTGEIAAMTLSQSSGNGAFDQSAMLAVQNAGRFVFMQDLPIRLFEAHFREFTFRFSPEDLRL